MEHKRISLIVSAFLLCLLSACQMTGVTPAPQPPGAGIIQNNPGGPIQVAPTSTTPTAMPTASSGCNQLGCPYPAVCDKTSGVCTINQQQGPGAAAPQAPGAGIISNNPNPGSLLPPACSPQEPSVSNINSFCANQVAKLGGATFIYSPSAGVINYAVGNNTNCSYSNSNSKATCSGPQNGNVQEIYCTSCGGGDAPGAAVFANFSCSKGYTKDATGSCLANDPNQEYSPCPAGSHYDNNKQYCVDDGTGQNLTDLCPAGTVTYLPDYHYCLPNNYPEVYNCQTFTIPLGVCAAQVKKVCQKPAGGCPNNPVTGGKESWNQASCSCK